MISRTEGSVMRTRCANCPSPRVLTNSLACRDSGMITTAMDSSSQVNLLYVFRGMVFRWTEIAADGGNEIANAKWNGLYT